MSGPFTIERLPKKHQREIRRKLKNGEPLGMARAADVAAYQVQVVKKPAPASALQKTP